MKKRIALFAIITLVIILIVISILSIYRNNHDHTLTLYGNVDVRQVDIGFRVAGQVGELLFEEGDLVSPGTLMAKLDRSPYVSQVSEAEAKLAATLSRLRNSEILLHRRQGLISDGSISQEELDDAQANYDSLVADKNAAEAAVVVTQNNLSYTEAFAPTEGIILTRIREPGTVVNPADPVYTLSVSSPVWIRAFVSEPNLGRIRFGMPAKITTDSTGTTIYEGKIGFISPVAEFTPKTVQTVDLRTDLVYRLRIYVDNPDMSLKQGMPVTVTLDTSWTRT